eukprot:Opistho-2@21011
MDDAVIKWIRSLNFELVTAANASADVPLSELLRNGVVLCDLVNSLVPNSIVKVHTSSLLNVPSRKFLCVANINKFLDVCRSEFKLGEDELFLAEDLNNGVNIDKAVQTLCVLSKKAKEKGLNVAVIEAPVKAQAPKEPPPKMTREQFREKVVQEVNGTEQGYIKDLMFLLQGFARPLKQQKFLSADDHNKLFGNIQQIFDFQKHFYKRLNDTATKPSHDQRIGRVFIDATQEFKVYTMYCANHPNAVSAVMKLDTRPEWKAYGEVWTQQNGKFFDISSWLIKPIQRICKYPLLLRELIKYTDEVHPDYGDLRKAMEAMEGVTAYINEMKRKIENLQLMIDLQRRIEGWKVASIASLGEMQQDGVLSYHDGKSKGELYFLLLEKMLVFCKAKFMRKDEYEFKGSYRNEDISVEDIPDGKDARNSFKLHITDPLTDTREVWTLICKSPAEKTTWLTASQKVMKKAASGSQKAQVVNRKTVARQAPAKLEKFFGQSAPPMQPPPPTPQRMSSLPSGASRPSTTMAPPSAPQPALPNIAPDAPSPLPTPRSDSLSLSASSGGTIRMKATPPVEVAPPPPTVTAPSRAAEDVYALPQALTPTNSNKDTTERPLSVFAMAAAAKGPPPSAPVAAQEQEPAQYSAPSQSNYSIPSGARPLSVARDASIDDLEKMLSELATMQTPEHEYSTLPPPPAPDTRASVEEVIAESEAMAALAAAFSDLRSTCAKCAGVIADGQEGVFALGCAWHVEHFACAHCNKSLSSESYFESNGLPYCEVDYNRLYNCCVACSGLIDEREFVTLGDGPGRRWHKEHFCCTMCQTSLMACRVYERDGKLFCEAHFMSNAQSCGGCGQSIVSGQYLNALDKQWHVPCFKCSFKGCTKDFPDGAFHESGGMPYCEIHFFQLQNLLCKVCCTPLRGAFVQTASTRLHAECFSCVGCKRKLTLGEPAAELPLIDGKPFFKCSACLKNS